MTDKPTDRDIQNQNNLNKGRDTELKILRDIKDALKNINSENKKSNDYNTNYTRELSNQAKYLKDGTKEKRDTLNITERLNTLAKLSITHDVAGLGTRTKEKKVLEHIEEITNRERLLRLKIKNISDKSHASYIADDKRRNNILKTSGEQLLYAQHITKELHGQARLAKEIENNKIADGFAMIGNTLESIPGLSGLAMPFKEAEESAKLAGDEVSKFATGQLDASQYSKKAMSKMKGKTGKDAPKVISKKTGKQIYGAAAQKALKSGSADLTGVSSKLAAIEGGFARMIPLMGQLVKALLVKSLMEADKYAASFQKNLGVSAGEAYKLNNQVNLIALNADSARVTIASLHVALSALNDQFSTAVIFSKEVMETTAEILHSKLLDEKATANLTMMANIHNIDVKEGLQMQEDAVNAVNKENKTRISLKKVLQEANSITGQMRVQMGAMPGLMGEAVTKAKAFGMEIKEVVNASKQLLDFESSIEAELTAELMLGKQLNLETARLAALTGDYDTLLTEINTQVGDLGDFMSLNVLQQDALAKSVGMTSDQLSDQLMKKANLNELAQEALDRGDEQAAQDLMALSTQESFKLAVENVKDAFISVMAVMEPVLWVVDTIAEGLNSWAGYILCHQLMVKLKYQLKKEDYLNYLQMMM